MLDSSLFLTFLQRLHQQLLWSCVENWRCVWCSSRYTPLVRDSDKLLRFWYLSFKYIEPMESQYHRKRNFLTLKKEVQLLQIKTEHFFSCSLLPSATVVAERLCFHRCLSVHGRGRRWTTPCQADTPPHPLSGRHPHSLPDRHPPGRHLPPWADTPPKWLL